MEIRSLIIYPVILAVLACLFIPFLPASKKSKAALFALILYGIPTSIIAIRCLSGESMVYPLDGGPMFGTILLRIDPLSAWFILLINITCVLGAWYGSHYMEPYLRQKNNLSLHWSAFILLHLSMIWICVVQHGLAFLVVWEVMSLSAFLLVMFDHTRFKTLNAGINYLIQTHIGVAFLTVAFIWTWASGGTPGFDTVASQLSQDGLGLFLLFLVGFGLKAGFVPLHTWLPHAHPAAPAHISGILSGAMVTMGIYGLSRVVSFLSTDLALIGAGLLLLSLLTAVYGVLSAAIHRDYKRILAFSTIENMGIIGMGLGIGVIGKSLGNNTLVFLGFSAAMLHVFNHALYKPLLFFASGNVYQFTHTRNIEHLGGLIRKMPFTAFFFLCGAVAVGGLPPFNGFISKFLLFSGMVEGISMEGFRFNVLMMSAAVALALVGGLSVLAFTKVFSIIFLGSPRSEPAHHRAEIFSAGHVPFLVILFLMLLIGLSPAFLLPVLERITRVFSPGLIAADALAAPAETLSRAGIASLTLIVLASLVYLVRQRLETRQAKVFPTWGCGYPATNAKMQYTGKAFSKSLAKLFAFITSEEKKYEEISPEAVFVAPRTYRSSYAEYFEKHLSRLLRPLLTFMNYFSFIHNGRVQYYVLYGFIFVLILIVATFSNLL